MKTPEPNIQLHVDAANPGQFFACCGLLELADRLWPGAEGWFNENASVFHIACSGSLQTLLAASRSMRLDGKDATDDETDDEGDEGSDDEDAISPLLVISPIHLRLDWWADKSLKPWAGSMNARRITVAMIGAINPDEVDPLNQSQVVYDPLAPTGPSDKSNRTKKAKKREPFYFDARRGANSQGIDVGFIPDAFKKMTTFAYPAVELFCLIGLQRARPVPTGMPRTFHYFTWTWPCPCTILPSAVAGSVPDRNARGFCFQNAFRTGQKKHKAYKPAVPYGRPASS